MVENFAVSNFSTKSVHHCIYDRQQKPVYVKFMATLVTHLEKVQMAIFLHTRDEYMRYPETDILPRNFLLTIEAQFLTIFHPVCEFVSYMSMPLNF